MRRQCAPIVSIGLHFDVVTSHNNPVRQPIDTRSAHRRECPQPRLNSCHAASPHQTVPHRRASILLLTDRGLGMSLSLALLMTLLAPAPVAPLDPRRSCKCRPLPRLRSASTVKRHLPLLGTELLPLLGTCRTRD